MSFKSLIDEIESNLKRLLVDLSLQSISFSVEPAKPGFGDVSSNIAFLLAKQLKKSPKEISDMILEKYLHYQQILVSKIESHPTGYVNFFANWEKLNSVILSESNMDEFGTVDLGKNSRIVVEHTSVNPNKALHIGHIRNIVLGDSVARILKKANYKVSILNYVDDSGLQVADIIVGFRYFGFDQEPPPGVKFDHYCGDEVYVKITEKFESDPYMENIRKKTLKELEDGTSDTALFGETITRRVLENQLETCWNLNVFYDCLNFESQIIHSGLWNKIYEKLKDMNMIEFENEGKNKGCWVIRGGEDEEDKVIVRSNGTATYIAKDIPYAAWKLGLVEDPFHYKKYDKTQPDLHVLWQTTLELGTESRKNFTGSKVITVIDSRQARLQKIISSLMSKFASSDDVYKHLSYESVTLSADTAQTLGLHTDKQTQMSGRKGLYVNADSVYLLLKNKTFEETKKRHTDIPDCEISKIAHHVSVGTLRYEMIKQDLDKIIVFDLEKSLSLEGDTAPYVQYTHARASRIIEKSTYEPSTSVDFALLCDKYELDLIKIIGLFDMSVMDAAKNLSPELADTVIVA